MTAAVKAKKKAAKKTTPTGTASNSRKDARTPAVKKQAIAAKKVVRPVRIRPPLERRAAMRDLSGVAKEAVDRYKAQQATRPAPSKAITPIKVVPQKKAAKSVPKPAPGARATTAGKTKRTVLVSNSDLFRQMNARLDEAALASVYDAYYDDDGGRTSFNDAVYDMLGAGDSGYVRTPVGDEEFRAFTAANPVIESQLMWGTAQAEYEEELAEYEEAKAAYDAVMAEFGADMETYFDDMDDFQVKLRAFLLSPDDDDLSEPEEPARPPLPAVRKPVPPTKPDDPPESLDEAVRRGDYFHVYNTNHLRPARVDAKGRARRIGVNVTTQQAGLKVAAALTGLFADPVVSPYLDHYKIYLTRSDEDAGVKHDKLVIYYEAPDAEDDTDVVGDRIVAAIDGAVNDDEVREEFAPFYARLKRGIVWAEEPAAFVKDLRDSFTGTRASIIDKVIDDNDEIDDAQEFIRLVREAFADRYVDPDNPHRHLPGWEPKSYPRMRRTPPPPESDSDSRSGSQTDTRSDQDVDSFADSESVSLL